MPNEISPDDLRFDHEIRLTRADLLDQAGIDVLETRMTHLAYSPEIAQAMLRRQQAEAVIAARAAEMGAPVLRVGIEPLAPHPATTTAIKAPALRDPASPTAGAKSEDLGRQGRELLAWAREQGAGDALLATTDGRLAEGATSNVFYVIDGQLRTPTRATGLLAGIARDLVLGSTGAREVDAPYEVLHEAEEVFLTSSLRGVQPVTAVDGRELGGPGPVTSEARAVWDALPTDD